MYLVLLLLGLVWGSFFNVYVSRRMEGISVINPPSHCDQCKEKLSPRQLIPILGYFDQGGKCSYCGGKIPVEYPTFEAIYGILTVLIFFAYDGFVAWLLVFQAYFLIAMARIDYKSQEIHMLDLLWLGLLVLMESIVIQISPLKIFVHIFFLVFIFIFLPREEKIGMGDLLLLVILTMKMPVLHILGYVILLSLLGGVYGLFLLLQGKNGKDKVAYVPVIAFSYLIFLFFQDNIYLYFGW